MQSVADANDPAFLYHLVHETAAARGLSPGTGTGQ